MEAGSISMFAILRQLQRLLFISPPRFIIRSRNVCGVLRQSVAAQFHTTAGSAVVTSDLVLCAVHVHCSKLPSLHSVNTICCKLMCGASL